MKKLLVICGPTATGKTQFASRIAKMVGGELVSADSRQIYTGMTIGTGKDIDPVTSIVPFSQCKAVVEKMTYTLHANQVNGIPIWMYDVVHPDEHFTAFQYQACARCVIQDIVARGNLPILVGGTGLYIKSLTQNSLTISVPPNEVFRKQSEEYSVEKLQQMLQLEDIQIWQQLNTSDRQNPRRLIRKIEIAREKNHEVKNEIHQIPDDSMCLGLSIPFSHLYNRIDARVDKRMSDGLLNEITNLMQDGYGWNDSSFSSLGYAEWKEWFESYSDQTDEHKKQILTKWKFHEHAYARRQMTWFKKQPNIYWVNMEENKEVDEAVKRVSMWYTK
jgi:tRNA dimethylallyltransferase